MSVSKKSRMYIIQIYNKGLTCVVYLYLHLLSKMSLMQHLNMFTTFNHEEEDIDTTERYNLSSKENCSICPN